MFLFLCTVLHRQTKKNQTYHLKNALELVNLTTTMNKGRWPNVSIRGPESASPGTSYFPSQN